MGYYFRVVVDGRNKEKGAVTLVSAIPLSPTNALCIRNYRYADTDHNAIKVIIAYFILRKSHEVGYY